MSSVAAKYTLFTPSGTPVRAVCTVTIEEISGERGGQNPTSGALAARERTSWSSGDTLPSIAFRAYGDPQLWRAWRRRTASTTRCGCGTDSAAAPGPEASGGAGNGQ